MKTVDEFMIEAFGQPRDPRSPEYKIGVWAALEYRVNGKKTAFPYVLGTAAADAYFSGMDEGHRIWRQASYTGTQD
ncbi:hypothetical protein [Nitrosovibrio sp. Nv6]|uniref:hypothetical protein n=1 Tax=Nitrosovibrio sp. Nv6 TaxID=1855340 RepID=UPI0008D8CE35|nr:hypothetical protein [Nitrosovibrio sp. Nv6]SEO65147.1 hypothetical protein SAMN05216316_0712 [Nitrosovibrio sp. Nv6]